MGPSPSLYLGAKWPVVIMVGWVLTCYFWSFLSLCHQAHKMHGYYLCFFTRVWTQSAEPLVHGMIRLYPWSWLYYVSIWIVLFSPMLRPQNPFPFTCWTNANKQHFRGQQDIRRLKFFQVLLQCSHNCVRFTQDNAPLVYSKSVGG